MRSRLLLITVAFAVLVPLSLFADPITGELAFTGNVTATFTSLNFTCATGQTCSSGQGSFTISPDSTGTFANLAGDTGTIANINSSLTPPGSTVSLANFLTIPAAGVSFTLTDLNKGTGGACPPTAGTTCTPPGTATIFNDTATGSVASFSVDADAMLTSPSGATTPYTGTFSATFDNMSTAAVLADLSSSGSISTPYSATFEPVSSTTTVPEPGTAGLFVTGGLLLLAGIGYRRFSHC